MEPQLEERLPVRMEVIAWLMDKIPSHHKIRVMYACFSSTYTKITVTMIVTNIRPLTMCQVLLQVLYK